MYTISKPTTDHHEVALDVAQRSSILDMQAFIGR